MDTREKIIAPGEARELLAGAQRDGGIWAVITGWFDPLTAAAAEWVSQVAAQVPGSKVLVVVFDDHERLLPAATRAALVAALRAVNAVTIAEPSNWRELLPDGLEIRTFEDPEGEQQRSREFVELILRRERQGAVIEQVR